MAEFNYQVLPESTQRKVDFQEAVQRGFNNYANFNGRASRSEYWWWMLFTFIVGIGAGLISEAIGQWFSYLVSLAFIVPNLAISWRRMHDIGKGGGWWFINFIPLVGWIIWLVWAVKPSEMFTNRFGEVPNLIK